MLRATPRTLLIFALLLSIPLAAGCKKAAPETLRVPAHDLLHADWLDESATLPPLPGPAAPSLLISAGLHGYTEPCGCTEDILQGGIDRLAGVAIALRAQAPHTLFVSAGDSLFRFPNAPDNEADQDAARLPALATGLRESGLQVMGVGPRDLSRGVDTLKRFAEDANVRLIATNLQPKSGEHWPFASIEELGDLRIAFLSILDASAFETMPFADELDFADETESLRDALNVRTVKEADLRVLFFHGPPEAAARLLENTSDIDFLVLGTTTDAHNAAASWNSTTVLNVWSQGRELGVLRLSTPESAPTNAWQNARSMSSDEHADLEELLSVVRTQISELEARSQGGEEPPILARLRERQAGYEAELTQAAEARVPEFSSTERQFLWDTISLVPGLPQDPTTTEARNAFNRQLESINLAGAVAPTPAPEGHASFVGAQTCASCHNDAHAQWKTTAHSSAFDTLVARDKHFDLECVGCHVTGYQQPGGSTLGFTTGLENVQCESCHGPGSLHAKNPTLIGGAQGIQPTTTEATCRSCHTQEHSPRFDYDSYLPRILGAGHTHK